MTIDLVAIPGAVHGPWIYLVVVVAAALESAGPRVVGWFGTVGTIAMTVGLGALVVVRVVRRRRARRVSAVAVGSTPAVAS